MGMSPRPLPPRPTREHALRARWLREEIELDEFERQLAILYDRGIQDEPLPLKAPPMPSVPDAPRVQGPIVVGGMPPRTGQQEMQRPRPPAPPPAMRNETQGPERPKPDKLAPWIKPRKPRRWPIPFKVGLPMGVAAFMVVFCGAIFMGVRAEDASNEREWNSAVQLVRDNCGARRATAFVRITAVKDPNHLYTSEDAARLAEQCVAAKETP